jgi:hypothetical protein
MKVIRLYNLLIDFFLYICKGKAQSQAAAFCAKWKELIDSGKVGYMALLRNLRNILEDGVSAE